MRVYFARHGETDWNALKHIQGSRDIPLNATGRTQAQLLADRLAAQGAVNRAARDAAEFGNLFDGYHDIDFLCCFFLILCSNL